MVAPLAVGGPGPQLPVRWDFILPLYVALSLFLALTVVRARVSVWTLLGSAVAGTAWKLTANAAGIVPVAGLAILVAMAAGRIRRHGSPRTQR